MEIICYPVIYDGDVAKLPVVQTTGGAALHINRENMNMELIDSFLVAHRHNCQWVLLKKNTDRIEFQPTWVTVI